MKNNTPKLRFKEFTDEWQEKKLGSFSKFYSGGTPTSTSAELYSGNIPFIKSGEINSEFTAQKITDEAIRVSSAKMVSRGDILYALYGATSGQVAISKIDGAINQAVLCIHPKADRYFIYQWLLGQKDKILGTYLQGGQGNLSTDIIKKLNIRLPKDPEQEKIAGFLTVVDEKINKLEDKKKGFEKYKKGVMQAIFSQKIRFKKPDSSNYPDWEEKKLGEIGEIAGGGTPDTTKSEFWNGGINWLTPTEVKSKYIVSSIKTITQSGLKNSSAKLLPIGTIIFTSRATVGDVGISTIELATNQGFQSVIVNGQNSNSFLYYWIQNNKKLFLRKSSGSTFPEISKTEMMKINGLFPQKEEQEKIAEFLTSLDNKVELINKELEQAKLFKKSLLQQMFV